MFPKEEEYLQVDLRRLHLVALVGTQGRHAGGLGKEFSRSYRLRYSRDGRRWMDWKDRWGQEVRLKGRHLGALAFLPHSLQHLSLPERQHFQTLNLAASYLPMRFSDLTSTSPEDLSSHSYPKSVPLSCSQLGETYSHV